MLDDANLDDGFADSSKKSWGTSITVDGTSYATSLFWQPLQNPSDPMQEIEETSAAVLEGSDLFCIKSGRAPQFGICVSQEGYKSGQYVAACSLVTAMENQSSFIAVFHTAEGWWYTCVRNDIVLSDGDMLFLSEEEAKNQFMSMLAVPDWGMKIAPKEWGIDDTQEISLSELMQRGARAKLQKIKALRGTKLLLLVVLSLAIGGWLISSLVDKLLFTPVKKPVVVPIRPKAVIQQEEEVKPVPKPWEQIKDPQQFLENCYTGVVNISGINPPGWKMGQVICTGTTVATTWTRDGGFITLAEKAIKSSNVDIAGYGFDAGGNTLALSMNLSPLSGVKSPPQFNMLDLRQTLNNEFQMLNLPISLTENTFQMESGRPDVPPAVYSQLKFDINSPLDPLTWKRWLMKYSGLEVNMITYSPDGGTWHYEGAIYVL